eukprot:scaffold422425_cov55-Attheya_sp.AAC.1
MFKSTIDNHPYKTCDGDIMSFAKWHSREKVEKCQENIVEGGDAAPRAKKGDGKKCYACASVSGS